MTRRVSLFVAAVAGALFGAGLLVSGMTQPARVIGFLDPTGAWDPSLAFVMGGAIAVYAIAHRVILRRSGGPWFALRFQVPERRAIDLPLVIGAALFGVGWGLGGMCPGPGIVAAAAGSMNALVFVIAMLAGMRARDRSKRRWQPV